MSTNLSTDDTCHALMGYRVFSVFGPNQRFGVACRRFQLAALRALSCVRASLRRRRCCSLYTAAVAPAGCLPSVNTSALSGGRRPGAFTACVARACASWGGPWASGPAGVIRSWDWTAPRACRAGGSSGATRGCWAARPDRRPRTGSGRPGEARRGNRGPPCRSRASD